MIINKFDVLAGISVVPEDILLSQKFYAILKRRRSMGRDFYDAMFLAGKTKPDFRYLKDKAFAIDAAPLMFIPGDAKKIELFLEFARGM